MKVDPNVARILERALEGKAPSQKDSAHLLSFGETSFEASSLRAVADAIGRRRFGNDGIVLGQVGVEISPCPGLCKFCSFGKDHTAFEAHDMSDEELLQAVSGFTRGGDLYAIFLMAMHEFDFQRLLHRVELLRSCIPTSTQIVVNIGDFDKVQARELKACGVGGAYHVCRLREGIDTALDPFLRRETIKGIREAGMDWYNCCEPIGPEHSPDELAEQIHWGLELGCFQHAAMRRVHMPHSPLAEHGQISESRLAQVVAAVTLAVLECPQTRSIAVHEPNVIGLASGANTIYAEAGANPRDTVKETSGSRGRDIRDCKRMLAEAGFSGLATSAGVRVPMDLSSLL